jgi:hypothetical protein
MNKMLLATFCLGMVGSAGISAARRVEEKPVSLEDLIVAVDNLSRVEERLPNIKLFVADAKTATDSLEKAYNYVKVLDIIYDAIVKQLVGVARGLTAIKGLGEKPMVKKLMTSVEQINANLQGIPQVVKELEKILDAREADAKK